MKRVLVIFAGCVLIVLPSFAADAFPTAFAAGSDLSPPMLWAPSPAARQCEKLGGIPRSADRNLWGGPQTGLCRLTDDSVIADWTLLRAIEGARSQAVEAFEAGEWRPLAGPVEGWAEQGCTTAGGQVAEYAEHLRPSTIVRLCEFPDGSAIEIWTMFAGADFYSELARVLDLSQAARAVFSHCPWPRTCAAPCLIDAPAQVLCRYTDGRVVATSFACCCCGSGVNSFATLPRPQTVKPARSP